MKTFGLIIGAALAIAALILSSVELAVIAVVIGGICMMVKEK